MVTSHYVLVKPSYALHNLFRQYFWISFEKCDLIKIGALLLHSEYVCTLYTFECYNTCKYQIHYVPFCYVTVFEVAKTGPSIYCKRCNTVNAKFSIIIYWKCVIRKSTVKIILNTVLVYLNGKL